MPHWSLDYMLLGYMLQSRIDRDDNAHTAVDFRLYPEPRCQCFFIILLLCRLTYNAGAYLTTCYSATGRKYNAGTCISLSYLLCHSAIGRYYNAGAYI